MATTSHAATPTTRAKLGSALLLGAAVAVSMGVYAKVHTPPAARCSPSASPACCR